MNPPKWAKELIRDTIRYLQSEGYQCDIPEVTWRKQTDGFTSSGCCHNDHIYIVANPNMMIDIKLVILHELTHWALPLNRNWVLPLYSIGHEGHTPAFWDLAWNLYRHYKLPIRYCQTREAEYRIGSIAAYHRSLRKEE